MRPGCRDFLKKMSKFFTLYMITAAEQWYADECRRILDPEKKLFKRVVSCCRVSERVCGTLREVAMWIRS